MFCEFASLEDAFMSLSIVEQGVLSYQPGKSVIMPSIIELQDCSLIAAQTVGSAFTSNDHAIEVLKSTDGGKNWRNLGSVLQPADQSDWSYRSAYINEIEDGRLVMNASRFEATPGELFDTATEALKRCETVLLWSNDCGEHWSSPEVVPIDLLAAKFTWNGSGRMVLFSPTRWVYPFETWKPAGYTGPPDQKAAAIFSADQGKTWGELTVMADDVDGKICWWDQQNTLLANGQVYVLLWSHQYGGSEDLTVHWITSNDEGRTWSPPRPTNLRGQVSCPVSFPDGRVAVIYNFRHEPQGIHVAVSQDLEHFDIANEIVVFDAKAEASLGHSDQENFLAEHQLIGFGKPNAWLLRSGYLLVSFWCTVGGVTHTRWARLTV
jgi:hypothetical protein